MRKQISQAKIAAELGLSTRALSQKVTEKTEFKRSEMYEIHDRFFSDTDMKYLFASDK